MQEDKVQELSERLNKKEEELKELSKEFQKLEFDYRSDKKMIKSVTAAFIVLLLAFFGVTLIQIPELVTTEVKKEIEEEVEKEVKKEVEAKVGPETIASINEIIQDTNKIEGYKTELAATVNDFNELENAYSEAIEEAMNIGINMFSSDQYQPLWKKEGGGQNTVEVPENVPSQAKGVILKAIVKPEDGVTGASLVCADSNGEFSSLSHHQEISVTNYDPAYWAGGMIFCPISKEGTITWQTRANNPNQDSNVKSYGTVIGWF